MPYRVLPFVLVLVLFGYAWHLGGPEVRDQPLSFVLGTGLGFALAYTVHVLRRREWSERERAYRDYGRHVANMVSLVYLKHAPCPACGHSPTDAYADGFDTHAAFCPILGEITGFGGPPEPGPEDL